MIPEPIASVLRSGREQYNARFALARRRWPELDAEHFAFFLTTYVAPLVTLTEQARPGSAVAVTEAAYDVGLELVGQRLAGCEARYSAINELWIRTLEPVAARVAEAPARVLPALCNAAHQLATTPGAHASAWCAQLADLGSQCTEVDTFLRLGQVLAWRAGLAHYRRSALAAADLLPPSLALAAVGAPTRPIWPELRSRLAADPWHDPRRNGQGPPPLPRPQVVSLAGAFRGFGGLFMEPPRVAATNGQLLVRSGDEAWLLAADVFGATFHRATPAESAAYAVPVNAGAALPQAIARDERVAALGEITSTARCGPTLAFTGTLTHQVVLVAL